MVGMRACREEGSVVGAVRWAARCPHCAAAGARSFRASNDQRHRVMRVSQHSRQQHRGGGVQHSRSSTSQAAPHLGKLAAAKRRAADAAAASVAAATRARAAVAITATATASTPQPTKHPPLVSISDQLTIKWGEGW